LAWLELRKCRCRGCGDHRRQGPAEKDGQLVRLLVAGAAEITGGRGWNCGQRVRNCPMLQGLRRSPAAGAGRSAWRTAAGCGLPAGRASGSRAAVCTAVHVCQKNGCTLHPLSVFAGRFRTFSAECLKCVSHGVLPCFLAFSGCLAIAFEDRGGHQPANRFRRMCYRVCFQLWGSSSVRPPTPVFLSARTRRTTPAR